MSDVEFFLVESESYYWGADYTTEDLINKPTGLISVSTQGLTDNSYYYRLIKEKPELEGGVIEIYVRSLKFWEKSSFPKNNYYWFNATGHEWTVQASDFGWGDLQIKLP